MDKQTFLKIESNNMDKPSELVENLHSNMTETTAKIIKQCYYCGTIVSNSKVSGSHQSAW